MKLEGAMTALVTPMRDSSNGVDFPALANLVEEQIAAGIDGLVAVGTTGESATLDGAELVAVIEAVVAQARARVPVIAGAGANSTARAIEHSRAAARAGADALLQVTPYYNKPTQDGLYRHFRAIAEATELPIILYNVPGRTSCDMTAATVARLAEIDSIVAVKEATGDLRRASEIIARAGDRITLLSGDDFSTLPLYAIGSRGVISVVSNLVPGAAAEMWDAVAAGDFARAQELHYQILPLTELLFAETSPIPVKAALEILGKIGPEIRPPLYGCSPELRERLAEELARMGLS